jgi:ADP-ribose pyrophosphatase YjhB (NUDIX family)
MKLGAMFMEDVRWLRWVQKMQTIAMAGLTYTQNPFDRERYHQLQEISAEMLAAGIEMDLAGARDLVQSEIGYATPKLDARGVVFRGDELLLVNELADGGWTLPGGWVDLNDSPSATAEREVWEESGYRVKARKLLGVYDRNLHGFPPYVFHAYKLFILCDLLGGEATTSIETGGAEFFAEDNLPPLSLARTTPELLQRVFEHHRHPDWPTDFD